MPRAPTVRLGWALPNESGDTFQGLFMKRELPRKYIKQSKFRKLKNIRRLKFQGRRNYGTQPHQDCKCSQFAFRGMLGASRSYYASQCTQTDRSPFLEYQGIFQGTHEQYICKKISFLTTLKTKTIKTAPGERYPILQRQQNKRKCYTQIQTCYGIVGPGTSLNLPSIQHRH